MLRVQSDLLKCMGRSTQQEIVDNGRVLKRDGALALTANPVARLQSIP